MQAAQEAGVGSHLRRLTQAQSTALKRFPLRAQNSFHASSPDSDEESRRRRLNPRTCPICRRGTRSIYQEFGLASAWIGVLVDGSSIEFCLSESAGCLDGSESESVSSRDFDRTTYVRTLLANPSVFAFSMSLAPVRGLSRKLILRAASWAMAT